MVPERKHVIYGNAELVDRVSGEGGREGGRGGGGRGGMSTSWK